MNTIVKSLAKVTASAVVLTLAVGLFNTAQAQSARLPGEEITASAPNSTQSMLLATELDSRAAERAAIDAGIARRAAMGSTSLSIATELPKAVDQALMQISIEKLMNGESKATVVVGGSSSLLDEHSISVKVNFEARPVGGILTVRASMAPTFRGVGVSTRPEISRSIAMAVDEVNEAQIRELVRELTAEIKGEFAHN